MKNKSVRNLNYTKALIICHGKSEYHIARYIKSNLRLPIEILANQKGSSSIQITSLESIFNRNDFQNIKKFGKSYDVEVIGSGNKARLADDFRIYIIMDTNDCTEKQREDFINKQMFNKYPLGKYVYPVIILLVQNRKLKISKSNWKTLNPDRKNTLICMKW